MKINQQEQSNHAVERAVEGMRLSVEAVENLRTVLMNHFEGDAILDNVTADAVTAMRRMQATITQRLDGELTKLLANDND